MARRWRAPAALFALGFAAAPGCGPGREPSGGVVVRQVLRGAEASAPEVLPPARQQAGAAPTGTSQPIAPSGSTLVADTPQAIYRRALEKARRSDGSVSLKQRLAAVEADMEQQQENEP